MFHWCYIICHTCPVVDDGFVGVVLIILSLVPITDAINFLERYTSPPHAATL